MKIHHHGYACKDLQQALKQFQQILDYVAVSDIVYDPLQEASVCLIETKERPYIELVSGKAVESFAQEEPILYHVCYEVDDLAEAISSHLKDGSVLVSESKPAILFHGREVAFIKTEAGLIEFLESEAAYQKRQSKYNVTITASFTADLLEKPLHYLSEHLHFPLQLFFAPYNQIHQQLLDPESLYQTNNNGINFILLRAEDWIRYKENASVSTHYSFLLEVALDFADALEQALKNGSSPCVVILCPSLVSPIDKKEKKLLNDAIKKNLATLQKIYQHLYILDLSRVCENESEQEFFNEQSNVLGHIPYSSLGFSHIALCMMQKIYVLQKTPLKVIVVDADNTLWSGICGEQNLEEITITPRELFIQRTLLQQHQQGILLCLASKNNAEDVEKIFLEKKDMPLTIDKFFIKKISWNKKSQSILEVSKELCIGLESIVFIDDNPAECIEVRMSLPDVITLHLPLDFAETTTRINHFWPFQAGAITQEDLNRNRYYADNCAREKLRSSTSNFNDFIEQLSIELKIVPLEDQDVERVSQLTQRVNQFNFTAKKSSVAEIIFLRRSKTKKILAIHVSDKFGDYGLVGVVVFSVDKKNATFKIADFLLSCRVLGKGVEYKIVQSLAAMAQREQCADMMFCFKKTVKNRPSEIFFNVIDPTVKIQENKTYFGNIKTSTALTLTYRQSDVVEQEQKNLNEKFSETIISRFSPVGLTKIAEELNTAKKLSVVFEKNEETIATPYDFDNKKSLESVEKCLIALWESFFETKPLMSSSDFYDISGESIVAIQLMMKIFKAFKINFSLKDFFNHSTIGKMANYIFSLVKDNEKNIYPAIVKQDRARLHDLSYAQRRLWFLGQVSQSSSAYNTFLALDVIGDLNIFALEQAIAEIIKRHEIFRTSYLKKYDEPKQVIHPYENVEFSVSVIDVVNIDEVGIFNLIHEEAQKPFDLGKPPLIRVNVLKRSLNHHVLLINMHHMTNDTWSYNIFIRELNKFYRTFHHEEVVAEPDLPIQYIDYAVWHNQWIRHWAPLQEQMGYWKQKLADIDTFNFLLDYRKNQEVEKIGKKTAFSFPAQLTKQLYQLSQDQQASPFVTLVSIFSLLIGRYANQEEVLISTVTTGRQHPDVENIIGFFVNILLLRINFEDNPDFINFLAKNKETILEAFANQDVPFEKVVEAVHPHRNSLHLPITNVMFIYEPNAIENFDFPGATIKRSFADNDAFLLSDYDSAKFDFCMYIQGDKETLKGVIEYDAELFTEATVVDFIKRFEVLAKAILHQLDAPILHLMLLEKSEISHYLPKKTAAIPVSNKKLMQIFNEQAEKNPKHHALVWDGGSMTYADLKLISQKLATYFSEKGIKQRDYVGIYLENKKDFIISTLAILYLGGIVVPLSSDHAPARITAIVEMLSLQYMIIAEVSKLHENDHLQWIELKKFYAVERNIPPFQSYDYFEEAYVLFTSGSTGVPKGMVLKSTGIINLILNNKEISLNDRDIIAQTCSISFDVSLYEIWGALLSGAQLVLFNKSTIISDKEFTEKLIFYKINTLFLTTALFNQIVNFSASAFNSLKYLMIAGEAADPDLVSIVAQKENKPQYFFNGYGPAEATIIATLYHIEAIEKNVRSIPIGIPISNMSAYVLDARLNSVPTNIAGELYLSGLGLIDGYFGRTELTQEKFIFHPVTHEKLYKTGDIVKWLNNGNLQYIGRMDDVVKIRGFRVELHDIERALAAYPSVQQAVVLLQSNEKKEKQLVAYLVIKPNKAISSAALQAFLKKNMHVNMIPVYFFQIEKLPITPHGKIDKKKLLSLTTNKTNLLKHDIVSAETKEQKKLIDIFSEVLGRPKNEISIYDSFFDLGGHSLLIIKVVTAIQIKMGIELKINEFFNASTVADLSQLLRQYKAKASSLSDVDIWTHSYVTASSLIALQTQGYKKPLFLIHPVGGTVFCYLPLLKYLDVDRPCYAIQDPSIEAGIIMYETVEEMATEYIGFIKQVQPHGPYFIAGHSFGGVLAAEIAYQLLQKKEEIAFIGLFDTWLLSTANHHLREQLKEKMIYDYELTKVKLKKEKIKNEKFIELNYHRMQNLGFAYSPKILECNISLFKAVDVKDFFDIEDPFNGWQMYSTLPIDVYPVSGDHETMLQEPCVKDLAKQLKKAVNLADLAQDVVITAEVIT